MSVRNEDIFGKSIDFKGYIGSELCGPQLTISYFSVTCAAYREAAPQKAGQ
jgi:hypothetical protein